MIKPFLIYTVTPNPNLSTGGGLDKAFYDSLHELQLQGHDVYRVSEGMRWKISDFENDCIA